MNDENHGVCNTKDMNNDKGRYDVPADKDGKSPLTGSNFLGYDWKSFTCVELEVFALE